MNMVTTINHHLVKNEDLNHHGTLYAGRTADWFVESGFIAAASLTKPENIVCLKIHGMLFSRPVQRGEIVTFQSRIVYAGRTKLVAHVKTTVGDQTVVGGFITFIHVDDQGHTFPHNITIDALTDEEIQVQEQAKNLPE